MTGLAHQAAAAGLANSEGWGHARPVPGGGADRQRCRVPRCRADLRPRDSVRGLTTAAGVWVTAAVGAAAGAGLPLLAALATVVYFVVAVAFPMLTRWLPQSGTAMSVVRVRYPDGRGILRDVLAQVTARGFALDEVATTGTRAQRSSLPGEVSEVAGERPMVEGTLQVHGRGLVNELAAGLSGLPAIKAVVASDLNSMGE